MESRGYARCHKDVALIEMRDEYLGFLSCIYGRRAPGLFMHHAERHSGSLIYGLFLHVIFLSTFL